MQSWINANIYRWNNGEYIEVADKIVTEAPLQIMLKSAEEAKVPVYFETRHGNIVCAGERRHDSSEDCSANKYGSKCFQKFLHDFFLWCLWQSIN